MSRSLPNPQQRVLPQAIPVKDSRAFGVIAWSSLFFALLQSICTFFLALSGVRLLVGIGSVVLSASAAAGLDRLHADWIRVPMICLALLGSLFNLALLMQVRHLRGRAASRWRQRAVTPKEARMERLQWVLSLVTLVLVAVEECLHVGGFHTL